LLESSQLLFFECSGFNSAPDGTACQAGPQSPPIS
jgi:hypothetical protein